MLPMNTAWPWSSQACATSGIDPKAGRGISLRCSILASPMIMLLFILIVLCLAPPTAADVIRAGSDVQGAIDSAKPGDTIVVEALEAGSFEVDRPMTIVGKGGPTISAAMQKPAIKVLSDGVTISGLSIRGVGKDSTSKFNYYMQNPAAASTASLDDPNSAIVVRGNGVSIENCSIFGAQVGIQAENVRDLTVHNSSMDSCDTGISVQESSGIEVLGCRMVRCRKYGLDAEGSSDIRIDNNSIVNNTNGGILLKESEECIISGNLLSQNTFGLSLWNSSRSQIRGNSADHNYYGILVTAGSNYNNITENAALDNSRSEIVTGFGIGISLQENSSYNLLARNRASGNFNGLELSRGCQYNAVYDNNASDNKHGIGSMRTETISSSATTSSETTSMPMRISASISGIRRSATTTATTGAEMGMVTA